jgi:hypothetical protein
MHMLHAHVHVHAHAHVHAHVHARFTAGRRGPPRADAASLQRGPPGRAFHLLRPLGVLRFAGLPFRFRLYFTRVGAQTTVCQSHCIAGGI